MSSTLLKSHFQVAFGERLPPPTLAALRSKIKNTEHHALAHEEYGASFARSSWIVEAAINLPTSEQLLFTLAAPPAYTNALHPQRAWMSDKVMRLLQTLARFEQRSRVAEVTPYLSSDSPNSRRGPNWAELKA
jgi:hypothetical protein